MFKGHMLAAHETLPYRTISYKDSLPTLRRQVAALIRSIQGASGLLHERRREWRQESSLLHLRPV